ncbi:DNA cytosine methyltransferase [Iodobacter sp. CM08]|uniref:DNA cytosine methyltransferase n=1 Tax=Iodobacter sp. CM08 TaxID=3085902 RepID=UPI002980A4ED|nr:DNA cytosine methyltransferase [Iodobacter sp. CM08]MDW5419158.1 DNA cytosine methyltransferase [Iodobacter sp. CM08]
MSIQQHQQQQLDFFSALNLVKPSGLIGRHFVPEVITKELAIGGVGGKRKIRLSSNWLPLMGFSAGDRHDVAPVGKMNGLELTFSAKGKQKVYQRTYNKRKNNPLETVIEIGSQSVLDAAIPSYTERVHFTMSAGRILVRPLPNHTFSIRKRQKDAGSMPLQAFLAMSSGIDGRCLVDCGFEIDSLLEFRPNEKRDNRDLTETGALNALANISPRLLINEDISRVNWNMVREHVEAGPQIAIAHISLQCDDFSVAKANKFKQQSIDDLSTTRDLVYDALRMIETIMPTTVVVENVSGFMNAAEGMLLSIKLRKWGYHVTEAILQAGEFGGFTRRERYYLVASVYPDFAMPVGGEMRSESIWTEIEPFLDGCRDVSHTKSLQDGLTGGRARLIRPNSCVSPTMLKSQSRQCKDAVYIEMPDGRYLFPSLELIQHLQGIPSDMDFSSNASELHSEIMGQSIDYPMHHAVVKAVHEHLCANIGQFTAVNVRQSSGVKQI